MIRKLETTDAAIVAELTGFDISKRDDVNYDLSGISIEEGTIDSLIILGTRPITDYCRVSKVDKELGSREILVYYSKDSTPKCMYKTFRPFVAEKLRDYSLCWYIPKDSKDELNAIQCLDMVKCEYDGVLIQRMR